MAIDINNATFKLFTDFATTAKSVNMRAQLETNTVELGGTVRTVKASNNYDFLGNVWRLSRYKTANDTVRNIFRETIAGICGKVRYFGSEFRRRRGSPGLQRHSCFVCGGHDLGDLQRGQPLIN